MMTSTNSDHEERVEQAIAIDVHARHNKADWPLSDTSPDSSDEHTHRDDDGGRVGDRRNDGTSLARRRSNRIIVLAFLPFVAASIALGFIVAGQRRGLKGDGGGAPRSEDLGGGLAEATSDNGETIERDRVVPSWPTESPTDGPSRYPTSAPDSGKQQQQATTTTTAATATIAAPSSPTTVSPTMPDATGHGSEDATDGNYLRATTSPTTSSPTLPEAMPDSSLKTPKDSTPPTTSPTIATAPPTSSPTTSSTVATSSPTTSPTIATSSPMSPAVSVKRPKDSTSPSAAPPTSTPSIATFWLMTTSSSPALPEVSTLSPTVSPIPLLLTDVADNGEPGDAFPLGECQGDCDGDDDCEGSLVCFFRNEFESVPGCSGEGALKTDYCADRPVDFLYTPLAEFPLGRCEGDCDKDDDCEGSLTCFYRDASEAVPGCSGEGTFDTDYCTDVPIELSTSTHFPLELCEGDCDEDDDCKGSLRCFYRGASEAVPGCPGEGAPGTDYCADLPANSLSTSNRIPLGLCEGDCDRDADCEGDLVCDFRTGLAEISDCVGTGEKDSDYCVEPPSSALEPASATLVTSPACVNAGDVCPDDKRQCCSGKCEKDKDTGEKVCGADHGAAHGNLRAPTAAPVLSCVKGGELCPDHKHQCCSGWCEKNKETGDKVCGMEIDEDSVSPDTGPTDNCFATGEPCTDKKMCCSGWCMKAEERNGKWKGERKEDANEVCG